MAAVNPSSSSSPHTFNRSLTNPNRIHRPCLFKLPFYSHDRKLPSVRCQIPKFEPKRSAVNSETTSSSSTCIDFLTLCHSLKTTKRKGWVNHGITGPESIADHMYRMSLMALIVGDLPGINRERCIKIAIVHDIAEAIVGDLTPSDGVPKVEKSRLEQAALNEMCNVLGGGIRAEEIQELWREYEDNASVEANLVKDFDKVCLPLSTIQTESTQPDSPEKTQLILTTTTPSKRNNSPGFRVIGNRIYDSKNGKTCHQCRQKTLDFTVSCTNQIDSKKMCELKNNLWTVQLAYGFFKQMKLSIAERDFMLTLIARRSRHFAGTRYLKRGVNNKGRVANDVETEQIVFEDVEEGCVVQISFVVQNRGSIPLYWSEETSRINLRPDIIRPQL